MMSKKRGKSKAKLNDLQTVCSKPTMNINVPLTKTYINSRTFLRAPLLLSPPGLVARGPNSSAEQLSPQNGARHSSPSESTAHSQRRSSSAPET